MLTPDVVSFTAAISACEKGKQWEGGLVLLPEVAHELLALNVGSFSAAIGACEKDKQ